MKNKTRIDYIDILKGFGILLMVLGHLCFMAHKDLQDTIGLLIYSFHMPLFFIISGYCFKFKSNKEYILKKIKTIILPYLLAFFVISIPTAMLTNDVGFNLIFDVFIFPNIGGGSSLVAHALWFFPALFISSIIFNATKNAIKNEVFLGTISVLFMLAGFLIYKYYGNLPLVLNQSLIAVGFIYFGYFMRKIQNKIDLTKINPIILAIIAVINVIIVFYNGIVSIYSGRFGVNIIFYIINSIFGTLVVWNFVNIFYREKGTGKLAKFLINIGIDSKYYVMFSQVITAVIMIVLNINVNFYSLIPVFILTVAINFLVSYTIKIAKKLIFQLIHKKDKVPESINK